MNKPFFKAGKEAFTRELTLLHNVVFKKQKEYVAWFKIVIKKFNKNMSKVNTLTINDATPELRSKESFWCQRPRCPSTADHCRST